MSGILGKREYEKFMDGKPLTRKEAMRAMCYDCNGALESREDCGGRACPMYQYRLYPKQSKRVLEEVHRAKLPLSAH